MAGKDGTKSGVPHRVRLGGWRGRLGSPPLSSFLQLAESDFASTFRLLTVFAYGTYADYLGNQRVWCSGVMEMGEGQFLEGLRRNSQDIPLRSPGHVGSVSRPELALNMGGEGRRLGLPRKLISGFLTLCHFSLAEARNLPPLTEAQKNKLRHLSVVTLAAKVKVSGSPPVLRS